MRSRGGLGRGLRGRFDDVKVRLDAIPPRRATPVVLASLLFALTATLGSGRLYSGLAPIQLQVAAFVPLGLGWLLVDRLLDRRVPPSVIALVIAAVAAVAWVSWLRFHGLGIGRVAGVAMMLGWFGGAFVRGPAPDRRSLASLVPMAAVASWLGYDAVVLPYEPLRDFHLYLGAGATILRGASPYLHGPVTSVANPDQLPFVYPPLTAPLFAGLASLPQLLAEVFWVGGSIAAVLGAFWLLGVRGRWLVIMLAWPAPALGIAVGNVASYTFFLYALGFRAGAAVLFSGLFKLQSAIPTLWLLREHRWRSIIVGAAAIGLLAVVALPLMGARAWTDWAKGLVYFEQSFAAFPGIPGYAIADWLGPVVAAVASVLVVLFAVSARGRRGLARFGMAAIVTSPTLYLHGLSPALAGSLALGPELLWFLLGVGVWTREEIWLVIVVVVVALARGGEDLAPPQALSPARADIHPASRAGVVWPASLCASRRADAGPEAPRPASQPHPAGS